MTPHRYTPRLVLLLAGVLALASCDTRLPTQPGGLQDDLERPVLTLSLASGAANSVDVGVPVVVTVTASDNKGVSTILTTARNGAVVLAVDTVTYSPTQLAVTRQIPITLSGVVRGDRVVVRSTVTDAALNSRSDSLVLTIADTTAPAMTITSTKSGRNLKGGDTVDVRVTASDSAGIRYAGYRLLRLRATDSVVVRSDSAFVPAGTAPRTFAPPAFSFVLSDTLLNGPYALVGFALDASGIATRGAASTTFAITDQVKPTIALVAPTTGAKLNVGDSLLVTARLHDNVALDRAVFRAVSARGDVNLGTAFTVTRYPAVTVPATGSFPPGTRDTTVSRYLKVATPIDTLTDSLIVIAVVVDAAGNSDSTSFKVGVVSGPKVVFVSPVVGDSVTPGAGLTVTLRATHPVGVVRLGVRVQTAPGAPTPVDTTIVQNISPASKDVTFTVTVPIPANVPLRSLITLTPISLDVDGKEGSSAPLIIAVRAGIPPSPLVTQVLPARVETGDSVTITAVGNGIRFVGVEIRDATTGALIRRDSVAQSAPLPSTAIVKFPLTLPTSAQGKKISLISFAYDQGGRIGYSVRAGSSTSITTAGGAFIDSSLVVFGRTYTLPANRNGTIADLVVDRARGNVFLSNINFGRLEVWQKGTQNFDATGIVVGSQPWGMTVSRTAAASDTLYVANSGGTNLSRVYIGAPTASGMREDLANRLLTRVSFLYKVTETRDAGTGKIRITVTGPILFSDRPQYVEQSTAGRLYISTRPTTVAPRGTVRYLDPVTSTPDQRFILDFATPGSDPNSYLIANVDSVQVAPAPASSTANDVLIVCDHPTGTTNPSVCVASNGGIAATITALRTAVPTTDIDAQVNKDEASIGLTDTTYAASSGDGQWITFGEGNTGPTARNFLLRDDGSVPNRFTYASPAINVLDLINNASDRIFGVALDKTGKTLGIHGSETYFASVEQPFTQRLQGKKSTFNVGSGIAFHPNADGVTTPQSARLAFVASNNGTIEAVDIAYYDFSRGSLATKFNLYGPLRASLPFPGDDPSVVLKLFGISSRGLVIIDVTAADLLAGP